jgi:hypothetical protein
VRRSFTICSLILSACGAGSSTTTPSGEEPTLTPIGEPLAVLPRGYQYAASAFDAKRGVLVHFGGSFISAAGSLVLTDETWELRDGAWTKLEITGPSPRNRHVMAYDEKNERVILFGGARSFALDGCLADTWTFDGAQWTELGTDAAPEPRAGSTLSYDPEAGAMLLAGGAPCPFNAPAYRDLWVFDGAAWTRRWP